MRPDQLDDNLSAWLAELPPYERLPPLRGTASADVAIIGGGITGVSTAWHLSERFPDRRIVLLEAKALANGASGRNGGQVLNGINGVEPRDPDTARRVFAATRHGIDLVERLAAHSALDCGFARRGALEVQTTARSAEAAAARVDAWRRWGLPFEYRPAGAVAVHGAHGAVVDPTAGRVNAAAAARPAPHPARPRRRRVRAGPRCCAWRRGRRLTTPAGSVRAAAAVLATNGYTPLLGWFRTGVLPLHSHVVATAPLSPRRWTALGWNGADVFADDLDRIAYGARTPGGRLLFGGGGNQAYTYRFGGAPVFDAPAATARPHFEAVERRLRGYFPDLADEPVAHRWTGTLAITFDRVCSMGVTGAHRNVYYALGYSGHGLALGALAGEVLRDLYSGDHDPWRALPFYQKRLPPIPPEPLRWLGYQLYTRLTGRSPRSR
ncbi:MAG: FAD-binding oxidoreductase [Candidatus Binatia bacterium]